MSEKLEALRQEMREKANQPLTDTERTHWQKTLTNLDRDISLQIKRQDLSVNSLSRVCDI
jgi:hypothetical protein